MRFRLSFLVLATLARAELLLNYDEVLEGRPREYDVVQEVVGKAHGKSRSSPQKEAGDLPTGSEMKPRDVLDILLGKRQACSPGFGYCASAGKCCPSNSLCCSSGFCHSVGTACCPHGICDQGETCCGEMHCMPIRAQCCRDESHCEAGNHCYIDNETNDMVCCTDAKCTAHVENGKTTYATTRTTTQTFTTTYYQYYYWTVTWYYWYYYWTYSVRIQASVVTSTLSTTSSTLSVKTTNAAAASQYFSSISQTLTLPTPPAATSLQSLAGSTSFAGSSGDGNRGNDGNNPSSTASAAKSQGSPNNPPSNGGSNSSGARALWSGLDWMSIWLATFGGAIGVIAVVL